MNEQDIGGHVFEDHDLRVYTNGQAAPGIIETHDMTLCIPLTDTGMVIFILEPSLAYDMNVMMLPSSQLGPGQNHSEVANIQLQEQIGYRAARLSYLGALRRWSKRIRGTVYVYLARDLTPSLMPSRRGHEIQTQLVMLNNFERMMANGSLFDSTVVASLYMARQHIEREQSS